MDHINGNTLDDRWCNLREATYEENAMNIKYRDSGILPMGVTRHRRKYKAAIGYLGNKLFIGCYDTPQLAHEAYLNKRKELFGDFTRF
jgi:hypothetical protein